MKFDIIYTSDVFNIDDKFIIEQKIEKLELLNSGAKSSESVVQFYDKISKFNLLKIILNNKKNYFFNKKIINDFIKSYDLYSTKIEDIRVHDIQRFYNFIEICQKYKIKSVLEFGSGGSTLFFENLSRINGLIKVTSFDQTEKIIEKVKIKLSNPQNTKFYLSKVDIIYKSKELFLKFRDVEQIYGQSFDLIYIDAPVVHKAEPNGTFILNYVEDLLDKVDFKIMLFDKKYYNIDYLSKLIDPNKFSINLDFKNYSFILEKK